MSNQRHRDRAAVMLVVALAFSNAVSAQEIASAPVKGFNHETRLLAGRAADDVKDTYAGVQIVMPKGWKTYWRTPGDAGGIPPEFDWSKSKNLESATALFPAPTQMTDKSGTTYGYKDSVVFPIRLIAKEASKPIELTGTVTYGVCNDICVPAEAELSLTVPPELPLSQAIADALNKVPQTSARAGIDPALVDWNFDAAARPPVIVLNVDDPSAGDTQVFIEAPDGLFLPVPKRAASTLDTSIYVIDLTDGPKPSELVGKALTVTLAGAKGQSEATLNIPK